MTSNEWKDFTKPAEIWRICRDIAHALQELFPLSQSFLCHNDVVNMVRKPSGRKINPRMLANEYMQRCQLGQCGGACCLHGVWVDSMEKERILARAEAVSAWLPAALRDPLAWFDGREEADADSESGWVFHTTVLPDRGHYGGTACIFLREDARCALQCAGQALGLHPWTLKPFYCVLHPLDLDREGRITLDETEALLAEEGSCLRPANEKVSLLELFSEELAWLADARDLESMVERAVWRKTRKGESHEDA